VWDGSPPRSLAALDEADPGHVWSRRGVNEVETLTPRRHTVTAPNRNDTATDIALRLAIVALALGTAYIHSTLGGLRFTLNAAGYIAGAAAMIVPFEIARRYRWLIRLALAGYAATTIVAWALEPALYTTAYLAKAIEVVLIALLVIDFVRHAGNLGTAHRTRA
jgi:hypothetical protein